MLQLKDIARVWWKVEKGRLEKPVPWLVFRELCFEKFFPETAKADLLQQFLSLQQGSSSVDSYAADFTRLSK